MSKDFVAGSIIGIVIGMLGVGGYSLENIVRTAFDSIGITIIWLGIFRFGPLFRRWLHKITAENPYEKANAGEFD